MFLGGAGGTSFRKFVDARHLEGRRLLDAKARVEEQKLLDIHPEEYSAYIEHVPERFITLSPFANKNTSKSEKKSDHHPF